MRTEPAGGRDCREIYDVIGICVEYVCIHLCGRSDRSSLRLTKLEAKLPDIIRAQK